MVEILTVAAIYDKVWSLEGLPVARGWVSGQTRQRWTTTAKFPVGKTLNKYNAGCRVVASS